MPRATVYAPATSAKSRTAVARHRPEPAREPVAKTRSPSGALMCTSKSAGGEVHDSRNGAGGSSAQPRPSQARSGKKELRRIVRAPTARRSVAARGIRSVHVIVVVAGRPPPSACCTTSVVAFGRELLATAPLTRTFATLRFAPSRACTGAFGQRRKTRRAVLCSGANETANEPRTVRRSEAIVMRSA